MRDRFGKRGKDRARSRALLHALSQPDQDFKRLVTLSVEEPIHAHYLSLLILVGKKERLEADPCYDWFVENHNQGEGHAYQSSPL